MGSFFTFIKKENDRWHKHLTYEQQINLLQNDKELSISDSDFAKNILQKISYYSLIDGHKEPFKPLRSGKYYYGVICFSDV